MGAIRLKGDTATQKDLNLPPPHTHTLSRSHGGAGSSPVHAEEQQILHCGRTSLYAMGSDVGLYRAEIKPAPWQEKANEKRLHIKVRRDRNGQILTCLSLTIHLNHVMCPTCSSISNVVFLIFNVVFLMKTDTEGILPVFRLFGASMRYRDETFLW